MCAPTIVNSSLRAIRSLPRRIAWRLSPPVWRAVLDRLSRLCAWGDGCLLIGPILPADMARFRHWLVGASMGRLVEDDTLVTVILGFVLKCVGARRHQVQAANPSSMPVGAPPVVGGGAAPLAVAPAEKTGREQRRRVTTSCSRSRARRSTCPKGLSVLVLGASV